MKSIKEGLNSFRDLFNLIYKNLTIFNFIDVLY